MHVLARLIWASMANTQRGLFLGIQRVVSKVLIAETLRSTEYIFYLFIVCEGPTTIFTGAINYISPKIECLILVYSVVTFIADQCTTWE